MDLSQQVNSRAEAADALQRADVVDLAKYLLNTARMLAVLHARRTVVALLSRWPRHKLGPVNLKLLGLLRPSAPSVDESMGVEGGGDDDAGVEADNDGDDDADEGRANDGATTLLKLVKLVSWRRVGMMPGDCELFADGVIRNAHLPVRALDLLEPALREVVLGQQADGSIR